MLDTNSIIKALDLETNRIVPEMDNTELHVIPPFKFEEDKQLMGCQKDQQHMKEGQESAKEVGGLEDQDEDYHQQHHENEPRRKKQLKKRRLTRCLSPWLT